MHSYHPTIESFFIAIKSNNVDDLESIFDEKIIFKLDCKAIKLKM